MPQHHHIMDSRNNLVLDGQCYVTEFFNLDGSFLRAAMQNIIGAQFVCRNHCGHNKRRIRGRDYQEEGIIKTGSIFRTEPQQYIWCGALYGGKGYWDHIEPRGLNPNTQLSYLFCVEHFQDRHANGAIR